MKKRYEKSDLIIGVCFLFFITICLFIFFLCNRRVVLYSRFSGVVSKEDVLELVLTDDELNLFYKNKVFYINSRKYKYEIIKVDKNVLERGEIKYNYVFIKTNISDLLKVNDVVNISIMNKSIRSSNIFKIIWGGEID